ncbi:hypothetical protein ES702_01550 [subsurface metagenome]
MKVYILPDRYRASILTDLYSVEELYVKDFLCEGNGVWPKALNKG